MAILKLKPAYKDYIWGGQRLVEQYGKDFSGTRLAESWELSCHPDGASVVASGPFAGQTFPDYIAQRGRDILGRNCRRFSDFPILIKLIDAHDNLSIQVHPDNGYALRHERQYGKTEMWYIVDCEPGAFLYYGFSRPVSQEEFAQRIADNTLTEVLNRVEVRAGDVFFIEAGTIHAIGKGIIIAEIQQNSNVTYRVFDYGRRGTDGNPRPLHIEEALRVTKLSPVERDYSRTAHIAQCDYFTVDKLHLDGKMMRRIQGQVDENSFVSILILNGEGTLTCGTETLTFRKGDSLFLEAKSGTYEVEGDCEALVTSIGEKASPIRIAVAMSSIAVNVGLFDVNQNCLAESHFPFSSQSEPPALVTEIARQITGLLEQNDIPLDHCIGIGVGVPGVIDCAHGVIVYSNNIRWQNVPFAKLLQEHLPLPVYMQNDANCMALGESISGAAHGKQHAIFLNIGNGVGSAILHHGTFLESTVPGATAFGHMVIRVGGRACSCGRQGCLETYISQKAFCHDAAEVMREHPNTILHQMCTDGTPTPDMIFTAAAANDTVAQGLVGRYIRYLGEGIVNIINIFRPDCIILGGMLANQDDALRIALEETIQQDCFGGNQVSLPQIVFATAGAHAGLIGAANLI